MIIYNFIKHLILYIKYRKIIDRIYKEENIIDNFSSLFHRQFRRDWIGRLYVVINPLVDIDSNERIFESTEEGYSMKSFVNKWIMDKLNIANEFIINHSLFDLVTYHLDLLDENQNYLFTIEPLEWFDFWKYTKRFLILFSILLIIAITLLIIFI